MESLVTAAAAVASLSTQGSLSSSSTAEDSDKTITTSDEGHQMNEGVLFKHPEFSEQKKTEVKRSSEGKKREQDIKSPKEEKDMDIEPPILKLDTGVESHVHEHEISPTDMRKATVLVPGNGDGIKQPEKKLRH